MPFDYDLGVIGGGAAGLTVAAGAARLGVKVLLIEKENRLGGDCLHYGCVPSKTLIRTARVRHLMARAGDFGLPELDLPPVDYSKVTERIAGVISNIQTHDSVERFSSLGVDVRFGRCFFEDSHTVLLNGVRVSAARWVIATGSSPAIPHISGMDQVPYLTNLDLFSLSELPGSLVVLGGGPVAVEMAQAFRRLGCPVTIIQRSRQILSREDEDMARIVMESMADDGVNFILGAVIEEVVHTEDGVMVRFEVDGRRDSVCASNVLVAMGRRSNTDGLGLEKIGVHLDRGSVVVDARMRTSIPHIYAAGDVIGRYCFTHAAGYEGAIVVSNAVFRLPRRADYTWLPWCVYTDPGLAGVGLNEKRAREKGVEYRIITEDFAESDRALAENAERGRIKLLLDAKGNPLGCQIVSVHAGELISEWVAAVNGNLKLATIAGAVHPYPTFSEMNKQVAGKLIGEKIFSEKVRKILRILFSYRG